MELTIELGHGYDVLLTVWKSGEKPSVSLWRDNPSGAPGEQVFTFASDDQCDEPISNEPISLDKFRQWLIDFGESPNGTGN